MLGERLIELRKRRKMTQKDVSDKLNISRSAYAGYEIDRRVPEYNTLEKMANLFEVSIDYLVGRDEPKNENNNKHPAEKLLDYINQGLSDEQIKERLDFMVDVMKLSDDEIEEFMSFVRWQLSKKKQQPAASKSEEP